MQNDERGSWEFHGGECQPDASRCGVRPIGGGSFATNPNSVLFHDPQVPENWFLLEKSQGSVNKLNELRHGLIVRIQKDDP